MCIRDSILPEDTTDADGNTKTESKELATTVTVPVSWEEDGQSVVTVTYVVDGHEVEEFHPMETWHSGDHIPVSYTHLDVYKRQLLTQDEKKEYFFKFNVDGLLRGD